MRFEFVSRIISLNMSRKGKPLTIYYLNVPKYIINQMDSNIRKVKVRIEDIDIGIRTLTKIGNSFYVSIPKITAEYFIQQNKDKVRVELEVIK